MPWPQVERQLPGVTPRAERDWAYGMALTARSPASLATAAGIQAMPVTQLAQMLEPQALRNIPWSTNLYCTRNFALATASKQPPLNNYLRPVDALLLFPNGEVLLLSEREADQVQACICVAGHQGGSHRSSSSNTGPVLLSLPQVRQCSWDGWKHAPRLASSAAAAPPHELAIKDVVCLQLLNGEAMYAAGAQLSLGQLRADAHFAAACLPDGRQAPGSRGPHGCTRQAAPAGTLPPGAGM